MRNGPTLLLDGLATLLQNTRPSSSRIARPSSSLLDNSVVYKFAPMIAARAEFVNYMASAGIALTLF